MKKYLLLLALVCLLGNRALAQTNYQLVGSIDFHNGLNEGNNLRWGEGGILSSVQNYTNPFIDVNDANGSRRVSLHVDNTGYWRIGSSNEIGGTYLQMSNNSGWKSIYIDNLKQGDKIKLTTNPGKECAIWTNNTSLGNEYRFTTTNDNPSIEFTVTSNGSVQLQCIQQYAGIHKIELYVDPDYVVVEPKDPFFNYDPGYEVYDFFEVRDVILDRENNGSISNGPTDNTAHTDYSVSDADFELNGNNAQYFTYNSNNLTLNNRIAIDQSGRWRFTRGLIVPEDASEAYFSISNLKKGDRVQIFYTGDDPVFASQADGTYNGCSAFYDTWNDGDFNADDGDHYILQDQTSQKVEYIASLDRNEGTLARDEQVRPTTLHTSAVYVITEDGHMDFRLNNTNPLTRIVKVYIWSDHQATMIDDTSEREYQYTSHFDITGELQAKEHIVPGGLEVRIGNEDKTQHAIVVASKEGPVSYVNAVDGFKLPGITKNNNQIQINFNLGGNNNADIPTTGTFYKFIPEVDGTMKVKFTAYSMYYYRYDINGNAIYYDDGRNNDGDSPWKEEFGRANEQTVNRLSPYYIKVSSDNGASFSDAQNVTWGSVSSGSGSGEGNEKTLFTNPTSNDVLLISDIENLGGTDSDIITFYFDNVSDNSIGGLVDSNWGNNYNFSPNGQTGTMQFSLPLSQIRSIANGTGGVRANVWNSTLSKITLTTSGSSSSTSTTSWLGNGEDGEFVLEVKAGNIYYLYGGWTTGANGNNTNYNNFSGAFIRDINDNKLTPHACGVAELFDVAFTPEKQIYPLAKWVPSGTEADDDLAFIVGYQESELTVKKMSGNITGCHPYIYETTDNDGNTIHKLGIKDVTFKDGENPGGVVLIKFGTTLSGTTTYYKADPVYVFTVAYDADYHSTSNYADEERGHTWDFSSSSLNGLEWDPSTGVPTRNSNGGFDNNSQNYAQPQVFGTYFNNYFTNGETAPVTSSFLYKEMNYIDNGVNRSDWMFNYRLQKNKKNYDPRFLNKYDMEGDNADMIWDTEGIIIKAHSNTSCIFNEFGTGDIHSSEKDPDRYVGILSGGSFLIPHLNKDDRVIIYMGSGTSPDEYDIEDMKFNITNARDAEYKEIDPEDVYLAGGSLWNSANNDNNYRGCYHFFAKADGDMEFKLDGTNSVCKLYKIQIYHGDRINTNEIKGATADDEHYLLYSTDVDPNDANSTSTVGPTYNWTLNYFGKDQKIADGNNSVNNEIVARSGVGVNNPLVTSAETNPAAPTYNSFTYQHALGQIGTIRMRGKDMEKNMKYVADYAEHNVTVAYQETMEYPYTWDFMDVTGWGNNKQNFTYEDGIGTMMVSKPSWFDSDDDWNASYEKSSKDLSLWELDVQDNTTYYLRLNSQSGQTSANLKVKDNIFETAKSIDGNQYWANGFIVPETQGLLFYSYDNNRTYNTWGVTNDGLAFNGQNKNILNMVVPNVPANAAVYLRMETNGDFSDQESLFKGGNSNCEVYGPTLVDGTDNEYIVAILNKGVKRHLTFSISGYQLKKIAVSTDPKKIGSTGYATESRAEGVGIDHNLTAYLTGKDIKAYTGAINADNTQLVMTQFGATETSAKILPAATDGDSNGCILHHSDGAVSILNGGFHVFVPDMHDKINSDRMVSTTTNVMKSFLPGTTDASTKGFLGATAGDNTNLVLTAKKYSYGTDVSTVQSGTEVNFVRVDPKGNNNQGASLSYCSAYLQLPTSVMVPLTGSSNGGNAKLSIVFVDELFGEVSQGIATGIVDLSPATGNNPAAMEAEWYNLSGQKLNGQPTEKGMYIVNGKKVLVK
jgi:hypothetical protein